MRLIIIIWLIVITPFFSYCQDLKITDFGAEANNKTLNTKAIQRAIDSAYYNEGGRVIIPKGEFLTGTLELKSGVELHLKKGARLVGSIEINDYRAISRNKWKALLVAQDANKISISGTGTIDGQGSIVALKIDSLFYAGKLDSSLYQLKEKRPVAHARPQIIQFVSCKNVNISGVTIRNSASWVQTYDMCNGVNIDNIRVESVAYWNNDGIDIIDCTNVRITNSFINASDDGICIKSYEREAGINVLCENIHISHCTVRSSASAIKLGTSSFGGFKNVVIQKIKVFDTFRSAIAIECWETGIIENILVQDITAKNTGNAIFIRLSQRERYKNRPMGTLKNVVIRNVKVTVPFDQPDKDYELRGPALPFFHNTFPASITGVPGFPVQNILLENITIVYPGKGNPAYANVPSYRVESVPEKIGDYPEFSMFGELPTWGFYIRHADGLVMNNVKVKIKNSDYRPAFVFDDVQNLSLNSMKIKGDRKSKKAVFHETLPVLGL